MSYNLRIFQKPMPFQPGTLTLWSNEYIASNVLKKHLDTTVDSGSRKASTIERTVLWIKEKFPDKHRVLDIGCGPGLYAKPLCNKGFLYDGIDISPYQIEYAQRHNNIQEKTIFKVGDFRTWTTDKNYDLVLMLYGIYSFYRPEERKSLLRKLRECLSPNGCVITEVFTKFHYLDRRASSDWEYIEKDGFWSPKPYLELNAFHRYDEHKLVLVQAGVIGEFTAVWNSWIQLFDVSSLKEEFIAAGFNSFEIFGSCTGKPFTNRSEVLCLCAY